MSERVDNMTPERIDDLRRISENWLKHYLQGSQKHRVGRDLRGLLDALDARDRELLSLRAIVRDVAAKNPGWYDDILHTYVCLFCELTNPDIEQLEPVSQHDPECAYRRAVALTSGAIEAVLRGEER